MSNRLTSSAKSESTIWNILSIVWLAGATGLLIYARIPPEPPVIPEEAHELYLRLPSPMWTSRLQTLALTIVLLLSGLLVRLLVQAKASGHARTLATILGCAVPAFLLAPLLSSALGPQPLFPAWGLALLSGVLLFPAGDAGRRPLLCLSGLAAGLSLSLDAATMPVTAASLLWVITSAIRSPRTGSMGLVLWATSLLAGMLPVFLGMSPFAPGLVFAEGLPGLADVPAQVLRILTWGSLPFLLLALLAACVQLQWILLGWMLPIGLLQLLLAATRTDPLPETEFFLILPFTWLVSYGAFRLIKGVENGVRNVNANASKNIMPGIGGFTLMVYTAWALFVFFQPQSPLSP
jgi:hypothetical protein